MDIDAWEEKKQKQRSEGHCFKCNEWGHLSRDCPTKKVAVQRRRGGSSRTTWRDHKDQGGKRVGRRAPDSAATTKDLHTGKLSSSVGRSDTFISRTDTLFTAHSNIPPPHVARRAFTTSTQPPPVLESNNRYSILPIEDTNDLSVETDNQVVRAPPKLTKRLASNSS